MQRNYNAVVIELDRELPSLWVDSDDVTVPGFGDELAPAALEAARDAGYGISTAGRKACVYMGSPPGSSGLAERRRGGAFCARAVEIADAV